MKALIRIVAVTAILLILIYGCAKALNKTNISIPIRSLVYNTMPVIEDSLSMLKEKYPAVYQNLIREFKAIEHLKYSVATGSVFLAFVDHNINASAVFSLNGKCRYSVIDATSCLSDNIKATIKTGYPGYSIFAGKEIKASHNTIYQVIIENNNEYRVINFLDEEMEEQKKTKKTL